MINWYSPKDVKIWGRRWLTIRTIVIGLGIVVFAVSEFRFDWMETAVGAYLVSTNDGRPESGTVWDQGRQSHLARQTLQSYMDQRRSAQLEARRAASLGQVLETIEGDSGAMISADHFVALYLKLPPVLSHEIMSPYVLLAQVSAGKWQRTYLEYQDRKLLVFMLDARNQVVHRLAIEPALLEHIRRGEVAVNTSLDQLSDLRTHIYPADRFFEVLNTLPARIREAIIAHPEDLLRVSGRLTRVGISETVLGDAVDLGFEVEGMQGPRVILMQAQQDGVRRLQQALEGRSPFRWLRPRGEEQ